MKTLPILNHSSAWYKSFVVDDSLRETSTFLFKILPQCFCERKTHVEQVERTISKWARHHNLILVLSLIGYLVSKRSPPPYGKIKETKKPKVEDEVIIQE